MKKSSIDKIYKKFRNKYPDITSEEQIESLIRRAILRKKLLVCVSLLLISIISCVLLGNIDLILDNPESTTGQYIIMLLQGLAAFGTFAGVMLFAKTMHDPLTPKESKELQEKETYEKTGHK